MDDPKFIIVMGVSGTGKSTLGAALSDVLCLPFVDGDNLHPPSNILKMSGGIPLTDEDRQPWLESIRKTAIRHITAIQEIESKPDKENAGMIIACSALKKSYRDILRGRLEDPPRTVPTYFVFLEGGRDLLMERLQRRKGHFMKAQMLESQLATLECPEREPGVITVPVEWSTEEQVRYITRKLAT
ncbi:carbohydrate kinase [Scleroderma citrinum]